MEPIEAAISLREAEAGDRTGSLGAAAASTTSLADIRVREGAATIEHSADDAGAGTRETARTTRAG